MPLYLSLDGKLILSFGDKYQIFKGNFEIPFYHPFYTSTLLDILEIG